MIDLGKGLDCWAKTSSPKSLAGMYGICFFFSSLGSLGFGSDSLCFISFSFLGFDGSGYGGGGGKISSSSIRLFSSSCEGVTALDIAAILNILWDGASSSAVKGGKSFFRKRWFRCLLNEPGSAILFRWARMQAVRMV